MERFIDAMIIILLLSTISLGVAAAMFVIW